MKYRSFQSALLLVISVVFISCSDGYLTYKPVGAGSDTTNFKYGTQNIQTEQKHSNLNYEVQNGNIVTQVVTIDTIGYHFEDDSRISNDTIYISYKRVPSGPGNSVGPVLLDYIIPISEKKNYKMIFERPRTNNQ